MSARRRRRASTQERQRLEPEAPGVIRRGPPLTITCSCGSKASVRFGESWTCDSCGKVWDTSRIPRAEYDRIRRLQLRFRLVPVALGLLVVALAVFFTLTGSPGSVVLLLPIALVGWFSLLRGPYRRRYEKAIATRPKWTLKGQPR